MINRYLSSRDGDDPYSQISKKNKYNNQLIEKASIEIRERKNRDNGSKRSYTHASSNLSNSLSQIEKNHSAFLMNRERGGGDEMSNNVKSYKGDDISNLSDKKAQSVAQSYF